LKGWPWKANSVTGKCPAYITRYHRHLLPAFRDEADHLFMHHILSEAQRAASKTARKAEVST